MENEIMDNNVETNETYGTYEMGHNNDMGVGMLIGAAITGAAIAVFKWGKNKYDNHRAKKTKGVIKFEEVENNDDVTVE